MVRAWKKGRSAPNTVNDEASESLWGGRTAGLIRANEGCDYFGRLNYDVTAVFSITIHSPSFICPWPAKWQQVKGHISDGGRICHVNKL